MKMKDPIIIVALIATFALVVIGSLHLFGILPDKSIKQDCCENFCQMLNGSCYGRGFNSFSCAVPLPEKDNNDNQIATKEIRMFVYNKTVKENLCK